MARSDPNYSDIQATVSSMVKVICQQDGRAGYAVATGTLQAYLVEVIAELPAERRGYWHRTLSERTREIERKIIIDRLTQEETYE